MPTGKLSRTVVPEPKRTGVFSNKAKAKLLDLAGRKPDYARRDEFNAALDDIAKLTAAFHWDVPSPASRSKALREIERVAMSARVPLRTLSRLLSELPPIADSDLDFECRRAFYRGEPNAWRVGVAELRASMPALLEHVEKCAGMAAGWLSEDRRRHARHDHVRSCAFRALEQLWNDHSAHPKRGRRHFIARGLEALRFKFVNPDFRSQFDRMGKP